MAIYVDFKKPKTIEEFLKKIFSYRMGSDSVRNIETYENENCTYLQCPKGKLRSFDDILECVNTYFPEIDYKEVFKALLRLQVKDAIGNICDLMMSNCGGIKRIRMHYTSGYGDSRQVLYGHALRVDQYDSKYSWRELLKAIEINSEKEYLQFIKNKI